MEVADQLLPNAFADALQYGAQDRTPRGLEHGWRDQPQQRWSAHRHGQAGLTLQPHRAGLEPGLQPKLKVLHQPKAFQSAVHGLQLQAAWLTEGLQLNHGLDLKLEDLHTGHAVAVAARSQGLELPFIEKGAHHPVLVLEVGGQVGSWLDLRQVELLAGTEGQGHGLLADKP